MQQFEEENFPIDEWDFSSFTDELELDYLEDLLKEQDPPKDQVFQILPEGLLEI